MILSSLDLGGPSHPFATPITGQDIGEVMVEGFEPSVWPRGSVVRTQSVSFWVKAWQAVGGSAAGSSGAMKYLLKQIEELASSRDQQPVYIQWTATADSSALLNATELHDGWYIISGFEPNYARNVVTGMVQCHMTVTEVAPGAPRRVSMAYTGGALSSTYAGAATNLISLPVGSTALESSFTRTGGEGAIPGILSPVASPEPLVLSATIANIFKGGVHVYDTINTASNPVPVAGGTFVHASWVEVFYTDHNFTGDCVVTNGLQLLLFVAGSSPGITAYLWNTALATANWQLYTNFYYTDNASNVSTVRSYTLRRIGAEEAALSVLASTSGNQLAQLVFRLQRGRQEVRFDLTPLSQSNTNTESIVLQSASALAAVYTESAISDPSFAPLNPAASATYGYAAAFPASTSFPYIMGFLYKSPPAVQGKPFARSSAGNLGLGDSGGPATGATTSYGFFATPYGVNASYSTANLQAEAESGTLDAGWTSQANASASAGNEAKCASTTVATRGDVFGTAFVPAVGNYDVWFRVKVTSVASAVAEMQLGLWNSTDSAFVASGSTTYAPSGVTTAYAWYRVANNVVPTSTKSMRFRAVTTGTLATDWFIDEAVMLPTGLGGGTGAPQQIWQQFMYDRSVRLVRP